MPESAQELSALPSHFFLEKNILVPINYSKLSYGIVELAEEWMEVEKGVLYFYHVSPPFPNLEPGPGFNGVKNRLDTQAVIKMDAFIQQVGTESPYVLLHDYGEPDQAILQIAGEMLADLIIMGTPKRSMFDRMTGGNLVGSILHHCRCSLLVYKPDPTPLSNIVLVGIDFKKETLALIKKADEFAQKRGASLEFVHVLTEPPLPYLSGNPLGWVLADTKKQLEELVASQSLKTFYHCRVLESSKVGETLVTLQTQMEAGLLMIAPPPDQINRRVSRSTADYVINYATCPVYVFRAQTF